MIMQYVSLDDMIFWGWGGWLFLLPSCIALNDVPWYAVWLILHTGILLESSDKDLGHDFWEPGVYCSPEFDTGIWYARPQIMFGDDVFQRIIFEVKVDRKRQKQNRTRGGTHRTTHHLNSCHWV